MEEKDEDEGKGQVNRSLDQCRKDSELCRVDVKEGHCHTDHRDEGYLPLDGFAHDQGLLSPFLLMNRNTFFHPVFSTTRMVMISPASKYFESSILPSFQKRVWLARSFDPIMNSTWFLSSLISLNSPTPSGLRWK